MTAVNLRDALYEKLRDRIVYLKYRPGTALEEKSLCREFGVSRTPLREAILNLRSQGLVVVYPRAGSYVTDIDLLELKDLYVIKRSLEGLAAELAATRMAPGDVARLSELLSRIEAARSEGNLEKYVRIDQDFHHIVYMATLNQPLVDTLGSIEYRCLRGWYYLIDRLPDLQGPVLSDLAEAVEAFRQRDPVAARCAMEAHVNTFLAAFSKMIS